MISKIDNWEIELAQENNCVKYTYYPDWYVYERIDMI